MKKSQILELCILLCAIVTISSCATIFNGSKARVVLTDDNVTEPVNLTIDGRRYDDVLLPARVKVKRGFKDSKVIAEAEGYSQSTVIIDKKFNPTTLFNIIFGGIPGMGVDAATGAMMKPEYKSYNLYMKPAGYYVLDPAVSQEKETEMVSRDNPGGTDLENVIIRWYFDSDPRGARIYWGVISSIPGIVKNTNELYLMTTPYEETRSFNILGLTYENSKDVQIEIKMSKRGYEDQVKRFNVRQAIDQQEISGFFELTPKEEIHDLD